MFLNGTNYSQATWIGSFVIYFTSSNLCSGDFWWVASGCGLIRGEFPYGLSGSLHWKVTSTLGCGAPRCQYNFSNIACTFAYLGVQMPAQFWMVLGIQEISHVTVVRRVPDQRAIGTTLSDVGSSRDLTHSLILATQVLWKLNHFPSATLFPQMSILFHLNGLEDMYYEAKKDFSLIVNVVELSEI